MKVLAMGIMSIVISWAAVPETDNYILTRAENSIYGQWDTVAATPELSITNEDLELEHRYFYLGYSCNEHGSSDESNLVSGMFIDWSQGAPIAERRTLYAYQDSTHFLVVDLYPAGDHWVCTWNFSTLNEYVQAECDLDYNDDGVIGVSDLVDFADKYDAGVYDRDDLTAFTAMYTKATKFYFERGQQ